MADDGASAFYSNAFLPDLLEKKSGYTFGQNETLLLISLYQKYEAYFSDVSYNKKAIWQMIADDMKKSGYSPSATNCENRWKCLTSSFRKCKDNNNKSGRSRHIILLRNVYSCQICYAMFTRARTAHPDGRFFMQAIRILFRAFCSNHSYSRIVGKKTRPYIMAQKLHIDISILAVCRMFVK